MEINDQTKRESINKERRRRYHNNKEKHNEYMKSYRKTNKEKINKNNREWRKNNKDKSREGKLKHLYGITLADYDNMLASQGGVCAICHSDSPGAGGRFQVDHNHATGAVRGVLCNKCNTGIAIFDDNVDVLKSAIKYIRGG